MCRCGAHSSRVRGRVPGVDVEESLSSLTSFGAPEDWDARRSVLAGAGHSADCVSKIISAERAMAEKYETKAGWCKRYGENAIMYLNSDRPLCALEALKTALYAEGPFEGPWTDAYFTLRDGCDHVPGVEIFPKYEALIEILLEEEKPRKIAQAKLDAHLSKGVF